MCFLRATRVHSPNGKSIGSAVPAYLTAESPYAYMQWAILSPKLPFPMGLSGPPCNTWFHGPTRVLNPNGISIGSAVFAGLTRECPYTLQWDSPFPLKIAPSHGEIWTPFSYMVPWAHPIPQSKRHLDRSRRFFSRLTSVTDRQTDHATWSVTIGRIYVRSTAMRSSECRWTDSQLA